MKNLKTFTLSLLAVMLFSVSSFAQEEEESSSIFDAGMDIYSSYIWRGAKFGSGPAFQPWMSAAVGGLEIGAWGSVNASTDECLEMDLYLSYSFDFGLSLGVSDYYFGGDWTDFSYTHCIEPVIGFEIGGFSFTAAYMLLTATDAVEEVVAVEGIPSTIVNDTIVPGVDAVAAVEASEAIGFGEEGDIYLEVAYSFGGFDLAIGAGNGQYVSEDDDFMICNVSLGTSKDIKITDSFSLPLSGSVTLNPSTGGFYIAVGLSL